jgi:hypothetical protein
MTTEQQLADHYFSVVQYVGTDDATRATIATTLAKLPADVATWAVEAIAFVSVGGEIMGHTLTPTEWGEIRHVVALDESAMRTRNGTYVVAHEIAHARLGHRAFTPPEEGTEAAADRLAAEWGFERVVVAP